MIRRRVVLPHPLGPRMTSVLPSGTRSVRFRMENAEPRRAAGPITLGPAPSCSVSVLSTSIRSIRAMLPAPTAPGRASPEACNPVVGEDRLVAGDRHLLRLRLDDQHPVERIAMRSGQCPGALRMAHRDGERDEALRLDAD